MSDKIIDALEDMADAFPRDGVNPNTFRIYLRRLERFPEPAVLAAIEQAIDTRKFFPTIGELTDIISELANGPDDLAETAWNEVQAEVRRVGYQPNRTFRNGVWYEPAKPEFSSPRIAEAVSSVGWKVICTGDISQARTAFVFTYRNLRKRDVAKVQRADFSGMTGPALTSGDGDKALKDGAA